MKLFFWKANKQIDEFACKLADEFYSQVQPPLAESYFLQDEGGGKSKKHQQKQFNTVKQHLLEASVVIKEFKEQKALGVYGKARLHMSFMSRLKALGYNPVIAQKVNEFLILSPL